MNPFVFNPTAEYDTIGYANYTNLGSHNCDCITTNIENKSSSYLIYPNPTTKGKTIYINTKNPIKTPKSIKIFFFNLFYGIYQIGDDQALS